MARRRGIKGKNLYQILHFGVILIVVSVGLLVVWGVREVRRDAAVVAVKNSARGLAGAVTVLVNAVADSNQQIDANELPSLKPPVLRKAFVEALSEHPALVSVLVSDEKGLRYMITRRKSGLMESRPEEGGSLTLHRYFVGKDGAVTSKGVDDKFDLVSANQALSDEFVHLKPGQINWRSAYRFHSLGESWLTASSLVDVSGRNAMLSYVFPVDKVVNRLVGAEKGGAEKIFLYWNSGKVLPVSDVGSDDAQAPADEHDPVIKRATTRFANLGAKGKKPYSFEVDGEKWWAYVLPLSVFGDTMSLGVALPVRNTSSTLTSDTFLQVFGGLLVLFAGVALFVLRRNRVRIEAMGRRQRAATTPEDILFLVAEGESATVEFKQTLRFNLKSGKNGKEIEHASIKTVAGFMNSDGGTLLVGVADNGMVTGFDEDKFESADKAMLHFNNLVNQFIGTDFSRYIDTTIIEVQGKSVLRVYCLPAGIPAFLHHGKNEEFYVRSGPASRQLTLSQFYEWLQEH